MNVCALMEPKSVTLGRSNLIVIAASFSGDPSRCSGHQWCVIRRIHATNLLASIPDGCKRPAGLRKRGGTPAHLETRE
jgi:hypothetical protein